MVVSNPFVALRCLPSFVNFRVGMLICPDDFHAWRPACPVPPPTFAIAGSIVSSAPITVEQQPVVLELPVGHPRVNPGRSSSRRIWRYESEFCRIMQQLPVGTGGPCLRTWPKLCGGYCSVVRMLWLAARLLIKHHSEFALVV